MHIVVNIIAYDVMNTYYSKNREKMLQQSKDRYADKREEILEKSKQRYENNKGRTRQYYKQYYENNKQYFYLKNLHYRNNMIPTSTFYTNKKRENH